MRASPKGSVSRSQHGPDRPHPTFSDEKATFSRRREKERGMGVAPTQETVG